MEKDENIWNYSIDEITSGYCETKGQYECLICGKTFQKGLIYKEGNQLYDAFGAVKWHVQNTHGNMVDYLLKQELSLTGISDIQRQLLTLMSEGKNDKQIAENIGIAQSTVRSHRFKLREKEKQAKLFLAMMASLQDKTHNAIASSDKGIIEEIHPTATMVDDRYSITEEERHKIVSTYMDENGALKQFPSKEKRKIIVLGEIVKNFKVNESYTERQVNTVLTRIYEEDYIAIRRALIEYGFMDRSDDCKVYRVKA